MVLQLTTWSTAPPTSSQCPMRPPKVPTLPPFVMDSSVLPRAAMITIPMPPSPSPGGLNSSLQTPPHTCDAQEPSVSGGTGRPGPDPDHGARPVTEGEPPQRPARSGDRVADARV